MPVSLGISSLKRKFLYFCPYALSVIFKERPWTCSGSIVVVSLQRHYVLYELHKGPDLIKKRIVLSGEVIQLQPTDRGMQSFCWGSGVRSGHIITLPQAHSNSLHPPAQNKLYSLNPFLPAPCLMKKNTILTLEHMEVLSWYSLGLYSVVKELCCQ